MARGIRSWDDYERKPKSPTGKRAEVDALLREWNKALGSVVDRHGASRHFMEGGSGVSCYVWAVIHIKDKATKKVKERKMIVSSNATNCLNPTEAMYDQMKKLPRLQTDHYESALDYVYVNLD